MIRGALALGLVFAGGMSVAQEQKDSLHTAMAVLPATVFTPTAFDLARYVDMSLLAEMYDGRLDRQALMRGGTGSGLRPFDALATGSPEQWRDHSGIDVADLRFLAGYGQPPHVVAIWGLVDVPTATAAFDALPAKGFAPSGLLPGVLANGEPGALSIANRDPANPWSGMLGQTSVVTRREQTLLHGADGAAFASVLDGAAMLDTAAGATLLAALDTGPGTVLQGQFFGPYLGLHSGFDPADLMVATPEEARAAFEAAANDGVAGVPLYSAAVIADVVGTDDATLLIALAYADCETADLAAARAAELWPLSARGTVEGQAAPSHVEAEGSGCAAVITIPGGQDNLQYGRAIGALMQRDLASIRIAPE